MRSPDIRDTAHRAPERVSEHRQQLQNYRDRTDLYPLNGDELRAMKIVGAFCIVNRRDLSPGGLERLMASGLMKSKTVFTRRGRERHEVVFLTSKGRNYSGRSRRTGMPAVLGRPRQAE